MTIRFAKPVEVTSWNTRILANPDQGNIFQGSEFAKQKVEGGWTPRYLIAESVSILALEKTIPGLGRFWYLPKGPGVSSIDELRDMLPALRTFAREGGVFAVKIEPELIDSAEERENLQMLGLRKTDAIQPNVSTVTVDISPSLEETLAHLNQKGRHAIRRAERDGVTIERVESTDENCQIMYRLLADTASGSFRIRKFTYYKSFWQRYSKATMGQLFFAYVNGEIVAGAYALIFGTKSTYKDGASIRERAVYGASHLLQWEVITWAKERGSVIHDLCGTPSAASIKDTSHPHYGLGRFKTSFNKEVTDYVGAWDIIIRPLAYKVWGAIGQRVIFKLHNVRHNENWW